MPYMFMHVHACSCMHVYGLADWWDTATCCDLIYCFARDIHAHMLTACCGKKAVHEYGMNNWQNLGIVHVGVVGVARWLVWSMRQIASKTADDLDATCISGVGDP